MKYALASCVTAVVIIGGMATGLASAAPGIPLEPAPSTSEQPAKTGQPVVLTPFTGSAECWSGIAPRTDPDCASGRYSF